jgi:hypothetical protein
MRGRAGVFEEAGYSLLDPIALKIAAPQKAPAPSPIDHDQPWKPILANLSTAKRRDSLIFLRHRADKVPPPSEASPDFIITPP